MKILEIGPDINNSKGGMATVIEAIQKSKILNQQHQISVHSSFVDGNKVKRIFYSIKQYFYFLLIYKKYDIFHIHVASYGSTFRKMFYLYKIKQANLPVIVHIHGARFLVFYETLSGTKKKKVNDFLNKADIVVALSVEWKEKFEETFGLSNCVAVNNGMDHLKYTPGINDVFRYKEKFIFLGRLGERKGVYDLIDAMEIVVKSNINVCLYLAGDGDIKKVRNLIDKKNLTKNIEIVGWVNFDKKLDLLQSVGTMILPSYNEGLPMAILESMAAGKVIISTTVGAIPEVVDMDNGILIEPGDFRSLADAMIRVTASDEQIRKISEANIIKIKNEFSEEKMHSELLFLFDSF